MPRAPDYVTATQQTPDQGVARNFEGFVQNRNTILQRMIMLSESNKHKITLLSAMHIISCTHNCKKWHSWPKLLQHLFQSVMLRVLKAQSISYHICELALGKVSFENIKWGFALLWHVLFRIFWMHFVNGGTIGSIGNNAVHSLCWSQITHHRIILFFLISLSFTQDCHSMCIR